MNLNRFLKTDRENAERKIKSIKFLLHDLIPPPLRTRTLMGVLKSRHQSFQIARTLNEWSTRNRWLRFMK